MGSVVAPWREQETNLRAIAWLQQSHHPAKYSRVAEIPGIIAHGAAREFRAVRICRAPEHTPATNPMSAQRLFPLILSVDPLQIPAFVNKDLCALTTHYYNQGVLNTFDFLVNIPTKACSLYDTVADQLNAPPQKAATASKWTE